MKMNTYEQKIEAKKERYLELAQRNKQESESRLNTAHKMADIIPFGQPILVGHHSESRDRNYRNRIHNNFEKAFEADDKAKYYESKAASVGTSGVSSDDPEAIAKLKEKLTRLEITQEFYKSINKAIKKQDDEALKKLGLSDTRISEIKTPDFAGRIGVPSYRLTNNNALIRSTKQRIEQLEKTKNDITTTEMIGDIEIIDNVEENRLQVYFPGIPPEEIRNKLKTSGFRWSPTNGCWQRFRSNAAKYSLENILKTI